MAPKKSAEIAPDQPADGNVLASPRGKSRKSTPKPVDVSGNVVPYNINMNFTQPALPAVTEVTEEEDEPERAVTGSRQLFTEDKAFEQRFKKEVEKLGSKPALSFFKSPVWWILLCALGVFSGALSPTTLFIWLWCMTLIGCFFGYAPIVKLIDRKFNGV